MTNLIKEMQAYRYKKSPSPKKLTLDHEADKWRYLIMMFRGDLK